VTNSTSLRFLLHGEGPALCPERYGEQKLRQIRQTVGEYYFAALYMGRPGPREGNLFKSHWFTEPLPVRPALGKRVRAWDLAASDGEGDFTVGVLMNATPDGLFVIEDVTRGQWSVGERDRIILDTARNDGQAVSIWIEEEGGSSGKSQTLSLSRMLAGFAVRAERATGDKSTRAAPLASQMEVGNVRLVEAGWNRILKSEFVGFPTGAHDDLVDASSLAFNKLAAKRTLTAY
jgi:predicted phage terminase large subunit-like protein